MPNAHRRSLLAALLAAPALPLALAMPARAHAGDASTASSLSLSLPAAVLVAAPAAFLSAGVVLTVVAVDIAADAIVWLVRRSHDGATASLRLARDVTLGVSVGVGAVLAVTVCAAGWLISAAGEVVLIVPSAIGEALLYNERIR